MKYEPLIYFAAVYNTTHEIMEFAEYDMQASTTYMGVYHFKQISESVVGMNTVWYDSFENKYYHSDILLSDVITTTNNGCYIDVCYFWGGLIFVWVVYPRKSYFINARSVELPAELFQNYCQEWYYLTYDKQAFKKEKTEITLWKYHSNYYKQLFFQYNYRYLLTFVNTDKECLLKTIEEMLSNGTHDKLNDGSLLKYHQAGKPKKLTIKWHIGKSEYSAYFWFEEEPIREVFDKFYGAHPDTKTDFVIRIDAENRKYELALYRYGLKEPQIIQENVYQLLVFKNKFEDYRSDNYNQERGAWIW